MNARTHNSRNNYLALILALLLTISISACAAATPRPEPSATSGPPSATPVPPSAPPAPTSTQVPTNTPLPSPTASPEPSPTVEPSPTRTPTPTALPLQGLTLSEAELFTGPDKNLPLVASYTGGITLTVLGCSADQQWLVVEIPPGQQGWLSAASLQMAEDPLALEVLPTPAGLATLTPVPMAGVRVIVRFENYRDSFGAHAITYISISTGQPKLAVDVEILKPDGKRFYIKRNSLTDNEGWIYLRFRDKPVPNGTYTLILTDVNGNVIQKTFEVLRQ